MKKRIYFLGIFLIVLMLVLFSQNVFAQDGVLYLQQSNLEGWKIEKPIFENNNLIITINNNWKDRTCTSTSDDALITILFFTYEELNEEKEKELNDFVWTYVRNKSPTNWFEQNILGRFEHSIIDLNKMYYKKYNSLVEQLENISKSSYFYLNTTTDTVINKGQNHSLNVLNIKMDYEKLSGLPIGENKQFSHIYIYFVDHCGAWSYFRTSNSDIFNKKKVDLAKAIYSLEEGVFLGQESENGEDVFENKKVDFSSDLDTVEMLKLTDAQTDDSKSDLKEKDSLSATFETKITENMICQGNVCFFKEWEKTSTNIKGADETKDLFIGSKEFNNANDLSHSFNLDLSNSRNIQIGDNLVYQINNFKIYIDGSNLQNNYFKIYIDGSNLQNNYFLKVMQEDLPETYLFSIKLSSVEFDKILEFQVYRKILNSAYCGDSCKIPQFMLFDLFKDIVCSVPDDEEIIFENVEIEIIDLEHLRDKSRPSDDPCVIYYVPGDDEDLEDDLSFKEPFIKLNNFNIFDLYKEIGVDRVTMVTGQEPTNVKRTYFIELSYSYYSSQIKFIKERNAYKEFMSQKDSFGLDKNELEIFFAMIGGESSFNFPTNAGDSGKSHGLLQLYQPTWRTKTAFNALKDYLPQNIDGLGTYYAYFDDSKTNLKISLNLGLAVFKYNLDKAKEEINNWNSYSDIDKAFILFYAHQFNINDTVSFFNEINVPADKENVIINCDPNAENIWDHSNDNNVLFQSKAHKKLGCVATVGSVRKLGWYIFALENNILD